MKLIHSRNTPYGKLTVEDSDDGIVHGVFIDGVSQGRVNKATGLPSSWYMQEIIDKVSFYEPQPRNALVLGGGVGLITTYLESLNIETDTIEQSADMLCVGQDYFEFNPKGQVILGDAFKKIKELGKYDLIIVDLYNGIEAAPAHDEFLDDLLAHTQPNGHILSNIIHNKERNLILELTLDAKG